MKNKDRDNKINFLDKLNNCLETAEANFVNIKRKENSNNINYEKYKEVKNCIFKDLREIEEENGFYKNKTNFKKRKNIKDYALKDVKGLERKYEDYKAKNSQDDTDFYDAKMSDIFFLLGRCYFRQLFYFPTININIVKKHLKYRKAKIYFKKAIELNNGHFEYYYYLTRLYFNKVKYDKALKCINKTKAYIQSLDDKEVLSRTDYRHIKYYNYISGFIYFASGRYKEAESFFEKIDLDKASKSMASNVEESLEIINNARNHFESKKMINNNGHIYQTL